MSPQKTHIDWLRFRTQSEPREVFEALKPVFPEHAKFFNLKFQSKGLLGFQQAALICADDFVIGRMDYGGESQKGWVRVDIPGKGCQWMQPGEIGAIEALPSAQLRRLDIALTTWAGEVGHDQVVQAHQNGRFTVRRPPNLQQILNSDGGRTCNIGKREKSDKFMRCYEKGYEMLAKLGGNLPGKVTHIEGSRIEDIYRCEVEFKAVTTDIPWDVVARRDQYFAGAYPFCADILPNVQADTLKRRPEREAQTSLAAALENCRVQFGPTLFTALRAYHGDITAVWEKILGGNHSQPLLEAGVLLVDHE
jgi:phage replication initiation protein